MSSSISVWDLLMADDGSFGVDSLSSSSQETRRPDFRGRRVLAMKFLKNLESGK